MPFLQQRAIHAVSIMPVQPVRKAVCMLTLQELKEITEIPEQRIKVPTAKNLRETGRAVAEKQLENNTWIAAYQNGYALYHACGHSIVFPIHTCGTYLYVSSGVSSYLPENFLRKSHGTCGWFLKARTGCTVTRGQKSRKGGFPK